MLSLIPLMTFILYAAYFVSVLKVACAAYDAPIGYEDEEGFHYGMKVETVRE